MLASCDHGVKLRNHDGAFSNWPEFSPGQLIDKMAECIIAFLLSFRLLNGELEFALNFPHEEVVDHNVVGRIVQFVLDSDQSEFALHALILIEKIDRLQQADEPTLGALQFRSHDIADSE